MFEKLMPQQLSESTEEREARLAKEEFLALADLAQVAVDNEQAARAERYARQQALYEAMYEAGPELFESLSAAERESIASSMEGWPVAHLDFSSS